MVTGINSDQADYTVTLKLTSIPKNDRLLIEALVEKSRKAQNL